MPVGHGHAPGLADQAAASLPSTAHGRPGQRAYDSLGWLGLAPRDRLDSLSLQVAHLLERRRPGLAGCCLRSCGDQGGAGGGHWVQTGPQEHRLQVYTLKTVTSHPKINRHDYFLGYSSVSPKLPERRTVVPLLSPWLSHCHQGPSLCSGPHVQGVGGGKNPQTPPPGSLHPSALGEPEASAVGGT